MRWSAATFEFVNIDDSEYVVDNPGLRLGVGFDAVRWAFSNVQSSNWHPLTWLSHMLDVELYGLSPAGHHATNLILHALSSALLFFALRSLTDATWRSAAAAALWAWHPLRVESVAWISERKDVLSGLFAMLTLWCYARWVQREGGKVRVADTRAEPPRKKDLAGELHTGPFSPALLDDVDVVCVSPGLSLEEEVVRQALVQGLPVLGDIELFAWYVREPVLAVTGPNGPSTVTALPAHLR